ncbi:hypothetical protein PGT21_018484 [Puccinia graminis f. sp. tritici]|uniref:Uncharacterized protein n=1 Tax=Puccinia graminis f. sp. tritici TaxID=56615 RepID=A0A5B0LTV3_PUCGR|nr:hypothetical protein PGT21_018484 [Puccinia graminis f. sp. tritici]KAA1093410.1 hypothetical protein PGTUg99_009850 [Puccinia graminis f. sp. tritici]
MKFAIILCGVLLAFIPSGLAVVVNCAVCKQPGAQEILQVEPEMGKCGKILPNNQVCNKERTKMFFRCVIPSCKEITVKNKMFLVWSAEDCDHENIQPWKNYNPSPSGASSSSAGPSSGRPVQYHEFFK